MQPQTNSETSFAAGLMVRLDLHLGVRGLLLVLGLLALLLGGSLHARRVHAAGIVVNSLADGAPANDSQCTLREAITNANNNNQSGSTDCAAGTSGLDTVTFSVGGTITLTSTLPAINDTLTLDGSGQNVTLSGASLYRVLVINESKTVELNRLTIADGQNQSGGAGIMNLGILTVRNSTFSNNGHLHAFGGAIFSQNTSQLSVTNSTFTGNWASSGGAIYISPSSVAVSVSNSTFSGNWANVEGGAIYIYGGRTLNVTNSTFSNNRADHLGGGGAISNSGGTLILTNSTLTGNRALDQGFGGGIYNIGTLEVTNSTIYGNTAHDGGGIYLTHSFAQIRNTIIANNVVATNRDTDCFVSTGGGGRKYSARR